MGPSTPLHGLTAIPQPQGPAPFWGPHTPELGIVGVIPQPEMANPNRVPPHTCRRRRPSGREGLFPTPAVTQRESAPG